MTYSIHYVLKGRPDGGDLPVARERYDDGYYWVPDGAPRDWRGPYDSRTDAEFDAKVSDARDADQGPWTYAFPLDGGDPRQLTKEEQESFLGEGANYSNIATVTKIRHPSGSGEFVDAYQVEIEGSYEVLTLVMTSPRRENVVEVYVDLLSSAAKYQ